MNLASECDFRELLPDCPITGFDCGDNDLNDSFNREALLFQRERLGQTFYYHMKETGEVVGAYSLAADSLKTALLPGSRRKRIKELIPREKALQSYPALLIGRLGVAVAFTGRGIGSQLMESIKSYCDSTFPNVVRFLIVDAYNSESVLSFYQKNNFLFVFSTEQQEKDNLKKMIGEGGTLHTRQMFYDMKRWR